MVPLILIVFLLHDTSGVIYRLNDSEYARMPPIYLMDAYEPCVLREGGRYCTVSFDLVSDAPSELFSMIQEYTDHTLSHFNHTKLQYGICVTETCNHFIETNTTQDLDATLEGCLNESLWRDYKLRVKLNYKVSCNDVDENIQIDDGDVAVAVICVTLLLFNIVGSLYGFYGATENIKKSNKFLACFSISSNWKRLVEPTIGSDPRLIRLKGFYGLRTITMILVISTHSLLPFVINIENTHYFEETYHNKMYQIIFNGTVVVQTFFIISGFLLIYNMQLHAEKHEVRWTMLPKGMLMRWLRLTPSYAVVLAVTSTWLRFAGSGPLWQVVVGTEIEHCRRDWWLNLLYLNNYVDNSQCMLQSWYLAADMQLHFIGLLVSVLATEPLRKMMLTLVFVVGLVTPAVHTYFQDLDATLIISPQTARDFFITDPTFNSVYKRGHTNLACFVLGLCLGLLVYRRQNNNFTIEKNQPHRYAYWATVPTMVALMMFGSVFYRDAARAPAAARAVYAALCKPVFGLLLGIIVLGMVFKLETVYRGILEWSGWAVPSRVSYCAYILHVLVIKIIAGTKTCLMHASVIHLLEVVLGSVVITFLLAIPFWLLVEAPLGQAVKLLTSPREKVPEDASNMTALHLTNDTEKIHVMWKSSPASRD